MKVFNQKETKDGVVYEFSQYQFTPREMALIKGKDIPKDPCELCAHDECESCGEHDRWVNEVEEFINSGILKIKQKFDFVRGEVSKSNSSAEVERMLLSIPPTLRIFAREGYKG